MNPAIFVSGEFVSENLGEENLGEEYGKYGTTRWFHF